MLVRTTTIWTSAPSAILLVLCLLAQQARAVNYSVTDLGVLPGDRQTNATAINEAGQVVGISQRLTGVSYVQFSAFLWQSDSGMTNLGDLPGGNDGSFAYGINDLGQVVGYSYAATGYGAFLWQSGAGMQDLNTMLDASGSGWSLGYASAINSKGQIVGNGTISGHVHAYLLTPVPEPSTWALSAIGALGLFFMAQCQRRHRQKRA